MADRRIPLEVMDRLRTRAKALGRNRPRRSRGIRTSWILSRIDINAQVPQSASSAVKSISKDGGAPWGKPKSEKTGASDPKSIVGIRLEEKTCTNSFSMSHWIAN